MSDRVLAVIALIDLGVCVAGIWRQQTVWFLVGLMSYIVGSEVLRARQRSAETPS